MNFLLCSCCMRVVKKQKKNDVLYFSARGTRSGILCYIFPRVECALILLCYIFPRVERALALFCYIFCAWNALWRYCVIFSACGMRYGVIVLYFSTCGTRSGVIVLYFPHVERALGLLYYIFRAWNALWRYCVIFYAC